jgi:hypothetical protein
LQVRLCREKATSNIFYVVSCFCWVSSLGNWCWNKFHIVSLLVLEDRNGTALMDLAYIHRVAIIKIQWNIFRLMITTFSYVSEEKRSCYQWSWCPGSPSSWMRPIGWTPFLDFPYAPIYVAHRIQYQLLMISNFCSSPFYNYSVNCLFHLSKNVFINTLIPFH